MPTGNVAVVGLGRVGLPLALSFARPRPRRDGRGQGARGARVDREPGACRSRRPGTQELLERVLAGGRLRLTDRIAGGGRVPTTSSSRSARRLSRPHRDRHLAHPQRHRRPAAGPARGPLADPALDRRARHHRLAGRLRGAAARLHRGRGRVRLARAGADRREPLPGGDRRRCPASSAAWATGSGAKAAELFEVFGTEIVQTTPVQAELAKIWTNILRYTQFALPNLLMMECEQYERERVRGDRPDQPRLPARRDRRARAHRRAPACARTSPSPRSARARRACCWPSRACTRRCRCSWSRG